MIINIQSTESLPIAARTCYSDTYIDIQPGEIYSFVVDHSKDYWSDWYKRVDGNGWDAWYVIDRWKRVSGYPIFYLMGCIDKDDQSAFGIGNGPVRWTAPRSGQLYFFANDYPMMYWNNKGQITINISRIQ